MGLLHLLQRGVIALNLEYTGIAVGKIPVGEGNDVAFRYLLHTRDLVHLLPPVDFVDESIDESIGAEVVAVELLIVVAFVIVHDRFDELFVEITFL